MRGKFVWCDGYLKTAEGFENTKARPLHHRYLLEALVDEGKIEWPAKNCLCGWYSQDPFNPDIINGREGAKWGVTPTLEECLEMIKEQQPKVAKYDYAATMEYLAAEYTEAEGEEILRIIRETGGGTFIKKATNSYDPLYVGRGHYVSEEGKEQKLPLAAASPDIILNYANSTIPTGEMLGTWVDGNDLYLDCSRWFDDYDQAIEFGKANHQLAIWDAGNNAEIRLDDTVTSDGALPIKWAWIQNWLDENEVIAKTSSANFYKLYDDPDVDGEDLNDLWLKYFWDDQTQTLYYWRTLGIDGDPIHYDAFREFSRQTGEEISYGQADKFSDRFAWGLEASDAFGDSLSFKDPQRGSTFFIYDTHGDSSVKARALEAVRELVNSEHIATTSEDTEPVGKQVGFIQDPHEELYPCLFRGEDSIPSEVIDKLKNHVLEPLSERFDEPDSWIAFSIYGSGISYNWDESGDMDIQMWVDIDEFLRYNFDEDMDQDELLSQVRMIVQQHNFPAFKDLGLTYEDCPGDMLIQYYPKPGTGSKEENLASKPYACYDMDTGTWLQKPIVLKPKFYGETFLMLMPKAEEIAKQAEALLADYKRDVLNWEFWDLLYRKNKKKEFKEQLDATISDAEDRKEGIKNMFQGIFGGRAEAYSPGGRGVKDERDIMQKLLEVWGTFQDLKHYAREPLPWEIEIPEPKESMAERTGDPELDALIQQFMKEEDAYLTGAGDPNRCDYRNPDDAMGNCANVTEYFNRWLAEKGVTGISAQEGYDTLEHGGQKVFPQEGDWFPPQWHGIFDTEDDWHDATVVQKDGQTYLIDWTAAQYGETEFPLVQRLKSPAEKEEWEDHGETFTDWHLPSWERKWSYKRLANFNIVSADVYELAQNAWKNLAEQQFAPYIMKLDLDNMEDEKMKSDLQSINREFMLVMTLLLRQNPETFKFFPWLWREYKSAMQKRLHGPLDNQTIMSNNRNHIVDILKQATALMEKIRTDPRPESKVPNVMADFKPGKTDGFRQLEAWTYENATKYQQAELDKDEPVFDLGDGWKIVKVHPDNLAWEGDQMGHCVGGYCDLVESGDSLIYSLRDPKNMPHATIEIAGKFTGGMRDVDGQQWNTTGPVEPMTPTDENDAWEVVQIQGKQNSDPVDAYKAMIKKWFTALKQSGTNVKWAGNQWNDEGGPEIYIRGDGDFQDWLGRGEPLPRKGELDAYGLPKIIDFSFDAKDTIQMVAVALVQSDPGSWDNLLQSEHSVQEILNGLMELINYQKELWPESADRVDQEVEAGIEAAYQTYNEKWDELRDMNFDYQYETMKSIWEYEYPGESWEDAWANSDPRTEAVQEQAEKYLDEEITAPYKDGLNLLKGLQAAIGVGEPVTGAVKLAIWSDIVEKATRYLNEGRVQMQNNMPDHSIATVRGDTGDWTTEIWRQDPSRPNTLSGWSCTCPWGEHSWGRTRIWKKYEGRPCAHTVVLSWESQRQPWDVDEQGNEQLELFDAQQQPGRSFDQYTQDIPRATPPNPNSPNLQLIEQLSLPGAFSSTQPWWSWQRTTAFLNGGFVRNKVKMIGSDDRGESYIVPRNTVGEVLYSDDNDTIVIFNLESGPLGAHLIRVEETTDKFMAAPGNILDRGPAPRRRAPNA